MRDCFELRDLDVAGRIGDLEIPRAGVTIETPALLPVINPHLQTITPATLEHEFGVSAIITNSYVIYQSDDYREQAITDGLRYLLEFSGAIITDSGSFQLAEYGEINVTNDEILRFQRDIGADVATPIDIPTPPDASRNQAASDLTTTHTRLEAATALETDDMLINAPIQGGLYPDLREQAATQAYATDLDVFPVGGVVPLLNGYQYADVLDVVIAAKRGLGADAPVHLFGAGHPMMFALAVAAGCDLFDSAAYALYARDDRYLTVADTKHLDTLEYLPCACPVCTEHTAADLKTASDDRRETLLARHNLSVSFDEIRTIKQAIRQGNLLELVERRARGHPAMLNGYRALLEADDYLETPDPVSKATFFYLSHESAARPEVRRHHDRLERLSVTGDTVLLSAGKTNTQYDETWRLKPPFGPYPPALADSYPLTAELPDRLDNDAYRAAASGVCRLVEANPDTEFTLAHWDWPPAILKTLPADLTITTLGEDTQPPSEAQHATASDSHEVDPSETDDTETAGSNSEPEP